MSAFANCDCAIVAGRVIVERGSDALIDHVGVSFPAGSAKPVRPETHELAALEQWRVRVRPLIEIYEWLVTWPDDVAPQDRRLDTRARYGTIPHNSPPRGARIARVGGAEQR